MFKRLMNYQEELTHLRLTEACARNSARVNPKVRLADILPIENSGISDILYKFALQSHFDFIVTDSGHMPLFAVEFDGPSHGHQVQGARDDKKDGLCERFELPILRIDAQFINKKYRNLDLLTWLVEFWFAKRDVRLRSEPRVHTFP